MGWMQYIQAVTRGYAASKGVALPDFDSFWHGEQYYVGDEGYWHIYPGPGLQRPQLPGAGGKVHGAASTGYCVQAARNY